MEIESSKSKLITPPVTRAKASKKKIDTIPKFDSIIEEKHYLPEVTDDEFK